MLRAGLFNFSKGELGPALHGRVDVSAYNAAARFARNVTVLKYGGLARRMGQRLCYELREPEEGWDASVAAARLLPFEYSIEQTYALLMTQAEMRPLAFGGAVLEDHLEILDITSEDGAIVEIAFHGYLVGEEIFLAGVEDEMGELLNGRPFLVTEVIDDDHFRLGVDTTGIAFTGAEGGTTRVGPPVAPPAPPVVPPPYVPPPPPEVIPPGYWPGDGRERRGGRTYDGPIP